MILDGMLLARVTSTLLPCRVRPESELKTAMQAKADKFGE